MNKDISLEEGKLYLLSPKFLEIYEVWTSNLMNISFFNRSTSLSSKLAVMTFEKTDRWIGNKWNLIKSTLIEQVPLWYYDKNQIFQQMNS